MNVNGLTGDAFIGVEEEAVSFKGEDDGHAL